MEPQNTEHSQPLTAFECIHFLSVASGVCSTLMLYLMLLGPLFIVIPWLVFYWLKQSAPYFEGWTWFRAIVVFCVSIALGLALGTFCLYTFIGGQYLLGSGLLAALVLCDLIYSAFVVGRRILSSS